MSEQQTPRPVEEDPTAVAAEVAAVTETGQADPPATGGQPTSEAAQGDDTAPAGSVDSADDGATTPEVPAATAEVPAATPEVPAATPEVPAATGGEPATAEPGGSIETDAAAAAVAEPSAEAGASAEQAAAEEPATPAAPEPAAPSAPRPVPRPTPASMPKPSTLPRKAPAPGAPAPAPAVIQPPVVDESREAAAAAAWGRVDPDGTVWVREAAGERSVGQYTGADTEEALAFYVRRYLDLHAQVVLFETRLPQLTVKEIDQTLDTLTEALTEPTAVGDIDSLRERLEVLRGRAAERRAEIAAERAAAKAKALEERTAIVERAEEIAAADPAKVHWRSSGDELRGLLDRWKEAQRSGPRLDRPTEDALWKRFSRARTSFDRQRGQYFAQLDATQAEAKKAKEKLIAEAEALSSSTEWGRTSAAYRGLMDEWKRAGRASRKEDDALWARFRAAQQKFFDARDAQNAQIDAEYAANLEVKLALLEQAEALLPVSDPEAAKAALRPIQDKWDEAGKVPRSEMQRVEARMRAVEQAVRDADQARWNRTDPEKKARAEGAAAQLQDAIDTLEKQLAEAEASGDARAVKQATEALEARKSWLAQVLRAAES